MSRGLGSMQKAILESLKSKDGRASTNILLQNVEIQSGKKVIPVSFYRALRGLQDRGLVHWIKEHGGPNSPSGLVSITRTNVLLIDVDSTIGNLALMKISKFHKQQGHNVILQRGIRITNTIDKPELIYISCLFTWNAPQARKLAKQFPDAEVHIGGSGVSLSTALPEEIEKITLPDYSLYPEANYNLMYLSRGCPRSCAFCSVPKMKYEGKPHPVGNIYDFWDKKTKKIVILDNNILSLRGHFIRCARQIIHEKLKVEFHALDIRFIDDEIAVLLKQMHIFEPKFAWDRIEDEYTVMKGIEILRRNGINRSIFYVLVGFDTTWEQDLHRVNRLRDMGQRVFLMIYDKEILKDKRYHHLRVWCNARMFFASVPFDEFVRSKPDFVHPPDPIST